MAFPVAGTHCRKACSSTLSALLLAQLALHLYLLSPAPSPGNVLLTASDKDTRGFTAKVVDFGLSRVCSGDYLRTRTLGCAEYM